MAGFFSGIVNGHVIGGVVGIIIRYDEWNFCKNYTAACFFRLYREHRDWSLRLKSVRPGRLGCIWGGGDAGLENDWKEKLPGNWADYPDLRKVNSL